MSHDHFTIFIDGRCPLCRREADFMRRLDRSRGRLTIMDIAEPGFDASRFGCTFERMMGTIHGLRHDGALVTGMEVFRAAYASVGWGWLLAPTGWPLLRPVFDALYRLFASWRLRAAIRRGACIEGTCRAVAQPAQSASARA